MKANGAPEKLYIDFRDRAESTWRCAYTEKAKANDIEYTRTDAFIEKAAKYLMEYEFNDSPTIADRRKRVDEFRNYMKGE